MIKYTYMEGNQSLIKKKKVSSGLSTNIIGIDH